VSVVLGGIPTPTTRRGGLRRFLLGLEPLPGPLLFVRNVFAIGASSRALEQSCSRAAPEEPTRPPKGPLSFWSCSLQKCRTSTKCCGVWKAGHYIGVYRHEIVPRPVLQGAAFLWQRQTMAASMSFYSLVAGHGREGQLAAFGGPSANPARSNARRRRGRSQRCKRNIFPPPPSLSAAPAVKTCRFPLPGSG